MTNRRKYDKPKKKTRRRTGWYDWEGIACQRKNDMLEKKWYVGEMMIRWKKGWYVGERMIRWRKDDTLKKELYVGERMIRWIKMICRKRITRWKKDDTLEKRLFEKTNVGERMTRLRKIHIEGEKTLRGKNYAL